MEQEYINNEFSNLVLNDNHYGYQFSIYDGYGNRTKFLRVDAYQLQQIKNILINK